MSTVNLVEGIWLTVNGITLLIVLANLWDSLVTQRTIKALNGRGRELQANLDVVKDALRLVVQIAFVAAAVPRALTPGPADFSPTVIFLLSGVIVTAITSLIDRLGRKRVLAYAQEEIEGGRLKAAALIEAERIKAAAVVEAAKIKALADQIAGAGVDRSLRETVSDTHDKVVDIHHRVAEDK